MSTNIDRQIDKDIDRWIGKRYKSFNKLLESENMVFGQNSSTFSLTTFDVKVLR